MSVQTLQLGHFRIHGLRDGYFHLDGGAMFGVVPRMLWRRFYKPDEDNLIRLGLNSLVIETGREIVLVETGTGDHIPKKQAAYYRLERNPGLIGSLDRLGFKPEDIDYVINTHLHFDHCGGNTRIDDRGGVVPSYPRARYIIQKGEYETGLNPGYRDKPSYMDMHFKPLADHGVLELVEGDTTVIEGIEVILTPGHTASHQVVKISSQGRSVCYLGDLVPTTAHAGMSYIMSYDMYPAETMTSKEMIFGQGIPGDWIFAFNHDPDHYFARIIQNPKGKYIAVPEGVRP
jgi:glyoxylase-like metal-dependent hydrolase (beta-lactamase superfamily II)